MMGIGIATESNHLSCFDWLKAPGFHSIREFMKTDAWGRGTSKDVQHSFQKRPSPKT